MNIVEKVARAICEADTTAPTPNALIYINMKLDKAWRGRSDMATAAIEAFLAAAAEEGWHMRPDEATEEMGEAWAKLALDRIQKAVEGEMRTVGMVKGAKENYLAMLAAAPEFEWRK